MEPVNTAPAHQATSDKYPVTMDVVFPEKQSRILALTSVILFAGRIFMLIPHIIVLYVVQLLAFFVAWINQIMILFTGHGSKGMQDLVVGSIRWNARVSAYMYGATDKYPPFKLDN